MTDFKYLSTALVLFLLCFAFSCQNTTPENEAKSNENTINRQPLTLELEKVADGLYAPVALENAMDGSGRIFIAEQAGKILILKEGRLLPEPFLDIRSRLVPMENKYMDTGILGFAFHPDYKNNGRFFVHYSAPSTKGSDHKSVLAEFQVSSSDPDRADVKEKIILEVEQPENNHNGGNIVFDKNGFLYIGFGDGGGQGDQHGYPGHGQNRNTLLGSIIRIDINKDSPYEIPADNPLVGKDGRDEIWAYGLRMPWRISFNPETGELFCGDVGQNEYEEVNIIEKGKNYGWRAMEGFHIFDSALYNEGGDFTLPINEYPHSEGISVTGGYVYRGSQNPEMEGKYFFGDWAFKIFYLEKTENDWIKHNPTFAGKTDNNFGFRINSFGLDEEGEIYVVTQDEIGAISPTGVIYKLKETNN
ncbi:PQQ-dependent sugar dehydrogenase [soil metagenome]